LAAGPPPSRLLGPCDDSILHGDGDNKHRNSNSNDDDNNTI